MHIGISVCLQIDGSSAFKFGELKRNVDGHRVFLLDVLGVPDDSHPTHSDGFAESKGADLECAGHEKFRMGKGRDEGRIILNSL